jgi:choline dehydrogenase-like flavoprotein
LSHTNNSCLKISGREHQALCSAIDTLIPFIDNNSSNFWNRKATDLNVDKHILENLAILPRRTQKDFVLSLKLLASPLPGLLAFGLPASFQSLTFDKRESLLKKWSCSRLALLRMVFASLKRMCTFIYYGSAQDGVNPNWRSIGYPGPPNPTATVHTGHTLTIRRATDLIECDTLVIGSGAGGGVVAGTLCENGRDVVVIDKGPYVPPNERTNLEHDMVSKLYESHGMQTTADYSVSLLAGSCLGGGTTVNWSVSWRPDSALRQEWADQHNLPVLKSSTFEACIDDVIKLMNIVDRVPYNVQSKNLVLGSENLGFTAGALPQNVKGCEQHGHDHCGFCLFGCKYGNKQDVNETFLYRSLDHGARIYANINAQRLHYRAGNITEVEAIATDETCFARKIRIRAKSYVLASGAINTPTILLRSGITHPQLGRNLYIHPASLLLGRYPEIVESWRGGMMTSYSDAAANLDNKGYGCKIEPAPLHPGLLAATLPWRGGGEHKQLMQLAPYYSCFAVITRDRYSGNVAIDSDGRPRINYSLHEYDRRHALQGLASAAAIHAAAGAEEVLLTHHAAKPMSVKAFGQDRDRYLKEITELNWGPNYFPLYSAHLMGTCRMGGNRNASPVDPEGRFYGIKNLYIADGSLFPSASGINPMITIQSLARYIALGMVAS